MLKNRIDSLLNRFRDAYGAEATFVARAPGRVNLLGEHTDYNGLPVLPMAIDACVLVAGRVRSDRTVRLRNVSPAFDARTFELVAPMMPYPNGDWGNYAKAAAQGLLEHLGARSEGPQLHVGADLLVDGNIPTGAGLSSSSALLVAVALAVLAANDTQIPFDELAVLLPMAERFVGTLSGGMDQTVSLLARQGSLLRIDFLPLRTRAIALPDGYSVVVCNSLVRAEKSGAAKRAYNLRVIECRLACRALEHLLGDQLSRPLDVMGDLRTRFPERPLRDYIAPLQQQVPDRPLSLASIAAALDTTADRLRQECAIPDDIGDRFAPVRRARHVLREAERVLQAEGLLAKGDIEGFARLMSASHASCRDDYEISCPELEELVGQGIRAGALAARLTGAGFGGCTVNLVRSTAVSQFLQAIDRSFYARRLGRDPRAADVRFVFRPQAGAGVVRLDRA